MGVPLGSGKENGEGRGRSVYSTSNLGPEWTGIAPHAKEGFQVSKRDSGTRGGHSRQRGITKGIVKGIVPCASDNANLVHIVKLCVCCTKKELCLGYK